MKETLWTIQDEVAFREMERTGVLRANEEHLWCGDYYMRRFGYDWIAQQMVKRIGPAPLNVRYPVWAWYKWEGKRTRRDTRDECLGPTGTPMVQIEFEADTDSFLLSDFDKWCCFLAGGGYIAKSEKDKDAFSKLSWEEKDKYYELSWERIFDMDHIDEYVPYWYGSDEISIQATMWQIELSQIKSVEYFVAK